MFPHHDGGNTDLDDVVIRDDAVFNTRYFTRKLVIFLYTIAKRECTYVTRLLSCLSRLHGMNAGPFKFGLYTFSRIAYHTWATKGLLEFVVSWQASTVLWNHILPIESKVHYTPQKYSQALRLIDSAVIRCRKVVLDDCLYTLVSRQRGNDRNQIGENNLKIIIWRFACWSPV